MSFINCSSREINCKLVYYGPGLCGKTTNLQFIPAVASDSSGNFVVIWNGEGHDDASGVFGQRYTEIAPDPSWQTPTVEP